MWPDCGGGGGVPGTKPPWILRDDCVCINSNGGSSQNTIEYYPNHSSDFADARCSKYMMK